MKKTKSVLALVLASSMLLAGCGKKAQSGSDSKDGKKQVKEVSADDIKLDPTVENEGTPIKGGTLKVGIVSKGPFKGEFNQAYASTDLDMSIMGWIMNGSGDIDESGKVVDGGALSFKFDIPGKKATIKINDKYTWSDGVPVTSKDFLRYYLVIGDKDYTGIRLDDEFFNVVGMQEYKDGKSDTVSGFKQISDKEFEVHFKEFIPSILWSGGIPFEPMPDHVFKDIPVKDIEASDASRTAKVLSPGPFKFTEIVPGQQVIAEANEYYYRGRPKVDKIQIKIIAPEQVVTAAKTGEFDIVSVASDLYEKFKALKNGKVLMTHAGAYNYIGFKYGHWDKEKSKCVTDYKERPKFEDPTIRKAMAAAIDRNSANKAFFLNLNVPLNQFIPPYFAALNFKDVKGYTYDLEGAKKMLEEAGYKDKDGDGFREDKNGQKMSFNFATMAGSKNSENWSMYLVDQWKKIGLDVKLATGRPIEFNAFYDKLKADDPGIDFYLAGWNTGSNPNPSGFWSEGAAFNNMRYGGDEKLNAIFSKINSVDAVKDEAKMEEAYKEFNNYMMDNMIAIPLFSYTQRTFVNNRVKKYSIDLPRKGVEIFRTSDIELTADEPIRD